MFKLEKLHKRYKSKSGEACDALVDVNITLPDTGLIFVVGASGSGKSTLLNLLGGLDIPSSGTVSYNGQSLVSFNKKSNEKSEPAEGSNISSRNSFAELDDKILSRYRNDIAGFIFQDYHLIKGLSVEQNISIPLSLQGEKNQGAHIAAALQKVGLDGFQRRRVNELSGGQKQRVAVARAVVKNPKVLLADEPTGNLDSETGEEIMQLLKELSQSNLVVVVTHDVEFAQSYGDYTIELQDGKVVSNNCPCVEEDAPATIPEKELTSQSEPKPEASLPFAVSAKLGRDNLKKRPVRTVAMIVVAILSVLSIAVMQMEVFYSMTDAKARILDQQNINLFSVESKSERFDSEFFEYIEDKYDGLKYLRQVKGSFLVKSSQDVIDFGFEFVGAYNELTGKNRYITEEYLDALYAQNIELSISGGKIIFSRETFPPEQVVGMKVGSITIDGIVRVSSLLQTESEFIKAAYLEYLYSNVSFQLSDAGSGIYKIAVNKNSVKNLKKFLKDMDSKGHLIIMPYDWLTERDIGVSNQFNVNQVAIVIALMFVFMIILVANTTSHGVLHRTREIGILKALGARNKNIFTIYYTESFIISALTFIFTIIGAIVWAGVFNGILSTGLEPKRLPILAFGFDTFLSILIFSFIPIFAATYLPLLRIKYMRPINAVKSAR